MASLSRFKFSLKKPTQLFGFFYAYWHSFALIFVLATLVNQSLIDNKFPFSVFNQAENLAKNRAINQQLEQQNALLSAELKAGSETNQEILESMARYRLGWVKNREQYYQISP